MAPLSQYILLTAATTPVVLGASILPSAASSSFPQCAYSCANLENAATSCEADPSGQQSIIDSCFCQSALLSTLHSSPDGTCDSAGCSASDLSTLESWYNSYCSSATAAGSTATATSSYSTTLATTTTQAAASSATSSAADAGATNVADGSGSSNTSSGQKSWWETHYRWIIMLAVLVIGFIALFFLAKWLRKRYRAKHEASRTPTPLPFMTQRPQPSQLSVGTSGAGTRTNTMQSGRTRSGTLRSMQSRGDMREVWGPHQHQAATRGWEYTSEGRVVERDPVDEKSSVTRPGTARTVSGAGKGKERSDIAIKEVEGTTITKESKRRRRTNSGGRIDEMVENDDGTNTPESQRRLRRKDKDKNVK